MFQPKANHAQGDREQAREYSEFERSSIHGRCLDPDSGLMLYRRPAGPGTMEVLYDPEIEEVVNGVVRKIDMCR